MKYRVWTDGAQAYLTVNNECTVEMTAHDLTRLIALSADALEKIIQPAGVLKFGERS